MIDWRRHFLLKCLASCKLIDLPQDQYYKPTLFKYAQFNNLPCWVYGHVFVQTCFPSLRVAVPSHRGKTGGRERLRKPDTNRVM